MLFRGNNSPVTNIALIDKLVAWADFSHIRILDLSTFSTVCILESPISVNVHRPLPVHIRWESNMALWIGWANSVSHITLNKNSHDVYVANIDLEWTVESVVCGVRQFDVDHLLILTWDQPEHDLTDNIQINIYLKESGLLVTQDTLNLHRNKKLSGPWGFNLMSSHDICRESDALEWSATNAPQSRGGSRGFAPVTVVVSESDVIFLKVRSVKDIIQQALSNRDFQTVNTSCFLMNVNNVLIDVGSDSC